MTEHDRRGGGETSATDPVHPPTSPAIDDAAPEDPSSPEAIVEGRRDEVDERLGDDADVVAVSGTADLRVPSWLDTSVQYAWRGLVLVLALSGLVYIMVRLYLVSLPIIVALILATLCVPPARRLERRGWPRLAAASLVVIGGIGSFVGLLALMAPAFFTQLQELGPTVIDGLDALLTWLEEGPIGYDREQIEALVAQAMDALEGQAGTIAGAVGSIALAVVEGVTALILAIVLLFFFVKDGAQIVDWGISRTPEPHRDTVRAAGARGWVALSGFVRGTATVALIDAIGIGLGLILVGVDLWLPLSVLVFFGGFVPVIGATVTGILAALVALASDGITAALIVGGIVLVVQQVESNLLQPTIMKRAVALHPVVILGVLTAGAVLIGIVGAFLAVPVTAVIAAVGNELRLRHEAREKGAVLDGTPIGGPGVDPEIALAQFDPDTSIVAARRVRQRENTPRRRRRKKIDATSSGAVHDADERIEPADDAAADGGTRS
jgi:predicted PurR-regulated permease PerM